MVLSSLGPLGSSPMEVQRVEEGLVQSRPEVQQRITEEGTYNSKDLVQTYVLYPC